MPFADFRLPRHFGCCCYELCLPPEYMAAAAVALFFDIFFCLIFRFTLLSSAFLRYFLRLRGPFLSSSWLIY